MNRVTNMVDAVGTTTNFYDTANRFSIEDGPWASDTVTNRWDAAGLRTNFAILQPASYFNNNYTYDSAKRLSSITSGAGAFNYIYHAGLNGLLTPAKLIARISLPNTSFITNFWDDLGRVTETDLKNSSSTILSKHAYVYNNSDQRTKQTFTDGGYVDYLYDDIGELYSARTYTSGATEVMAERFGYTFDPAWNITKKTNNVTTTTYTLNNLNQVTGNYTYDDNGNRTISNTYYTYTYDDENQLTSEYITVSSPWRQDFTYDGKMRLRMRSDYTWNGSAWVFSGATKYIYDGMLVVQERDYNNNPTVTYTRGTDLSGTFEGAGGIGGLLARSSGYSGGSWSTHNFYHADGNGNITYLVNSSQTLAASYKYNPFGGTISSSGSLASSNTYRFSSKEYHTNPGLYYYGYRFYDPNLQRWLNRDPIEEQGSANLYQFVLNNALAILDPDGRDPMGYEIQDPGGEKGIDCGRRIRDEVWKEYGIGGAKWDPADGSARTAHCIAHCRITRECMGGAFTSWLGGLGKELQDEWKKRRHHDGDGYDSKDMAANAKGRQCAKNEKKSCEEQCQGTK